MLREPRAPWPEWIEIPTRTPPPLGAADVAVTFVGHATFLIQTPAGNLLTDPMYSRRAGPLNLLGPARVRRPAVRFEDLPPIATVLLSHNHYDHCDLPTLRRIAKRFDPVVVTPIGNGRVAKRAGFRRVEELDWWEEVTVSTGRVTATPAYHFSARTPFDRNRALWGGFVLELGARRVYFAGDTATGDYFEEIPRRLGPLDLALFPIGAYEPRWFMKVVHVNPAEAVRAHVELGGPPTLAMHFGTFRLTSEGIDDPAKALREALRAAGIPEDRFRVPEFGETTTLERR
jgi:L-ascorbate metabolism protein UlaG (beta-lactamase superfamily)